MAKAQVGDLVRILPDTWAVRNGYAYSGEVVEVVHVASDDSGIEVKTKKDALTPVEEHEYEIFRKAGEEDSEQDALAYYQSEVLGSEQAELDAVEHPNHYTQGRFETIEVIEEITQGYSDGYVAYCVGNALKYLARAPHKHAEPTEDLRKAAKYLEFAIGRLTQDER